MTPKNTSPTYESWRQAVEDGLKGASFEKKLVSTTIDGLRIEPLYADSCESPAVFPGRSERAWERHEAFDLASECDLESVVSSALERGIDGWRLSGMDASRLTQLKEVIGTRTLSLHPTDGADWDSATLQVSPLQDQRLGASPPLQLAIALAGGLQAMREFGATPETYGKLEFELGLDTDFFTSIATLRAMRFAWARLVAASGGSDSSQVVRIHAQPSERSYAKRDPWVNILRGTTASFAAALGGADSILTLPFDATTGQSDANATRLASNTQALLEEEAQVGATRDPAAGSGYMETATEQIASEGWKLFQAIEARGGLCAARKSGWISNEVQQVAAVAAQLVARRKPGIVGVSEFPDLKEEQLEREQTQSLVKVDRLAAPFEALRDKSDAHLEKHGLRPQAFLANIGESHEFRARAIFATNLLAVAGIQTIDSEGFDDVAKATEAFINSNSTLCVITSSDKGYLEFATPLARSLKTHGATILLAGRPGDKREEWSAAGIDEYIHLGCEALEILERVLASQEICA
ncbi:MAG: methylmalonyl-CoA mutase [Planctomycetota bacterium]